MGEPILVRSPRQTARNGIVGPTSGGRKLAHETVAAIEDELFGKGWSRGDLIGTLPQFQKRFSLGRWACREAISIMQARGLIDIRRGPSGGLYVSRLGITDLSRALILYLALTKTYTSALTEAREIVAKMVVQALLDGGKVLDGAQTFMSSQDFRLWLARSCGNLGMVFLVELLDIVDDHCVRFSGSEIGAVPRRPDLEAELVRAINRGDPGARGLAAEYIRKTQVPGSDRMIGCPKLISEVAWVNPHKFAGGLCARLIDEILANDGSGPLKLGSESRIGERYGYNAEIVRQAVRMLEDIGIIESQRGRGGGILSATPKPGPVIRLICAYISNCRLTYADNNAIVREIATGAFSLAAEKVKDGRIPPPAPWNQDGPSDQGADSRASGAIELENRLVEVAGNEVLTVIVRGFALHYLFATSGGEAIGLPPLTAEGVECNMLIYEGIRRGDVASVDHYSRQKIRHMEALTDSPAIAV